MMTETTVLLLSLLLLLQLLLPCIPPPLPFSSLESKVMCRKIWREKGQPASRSFAFDWDKDTESEDAFLDKLKEAAQKAVEWVQGPRT